MKSTLRLNLEGEPAVPFKLSLDPGEKFAINGAVVVNGDRRAVLMVENQAAVLRDSDVIREDEARTPATRLYFVCMLSYLDADAPDSHYPRFSEHMDAFMEVVENPRVRLICAQVSLAMMNREYYRALSGCRELIEYETLILGGADAGQRLQSRA